MRFTHHPLPANAIFGYDQAGEPGFLHRASIPDNEGGRMREHWEFKSLDAFGDRVTVGHWPSDPRSYPSPRHLGPCETMARNAQNEANQAMSRQDDINKALAEFDKRFAAIYLGLDSKGEGRPIRTIQDALHYGRGRATRNRLAN
jgi:hypothetical protein